MATRTRVLAYVAAAACAVVLMWLVFGWIAGLAGFIVCALVAYLVAEFWFMPPGGQKQDHMTKNPGRGA